MLERRANANCRCGRPTTESSSFFLFFLRCGIGVILGSGPVRGRPVGAQTPFLFCAAKRNTAPIEGDAVFLPVLLGAGRLGG